MLKKLIFISLLMILNQQVLFCQKDVKPKNIIIMIGDGMGLSEVSASILSQSNSPYRRFNHTGLSITCSLDKLITDSGAGGTAIATGYRTNFKCISVDTLAHPLKTLIELAKELKKATGVVVTSSITNATPATFLSHVDNRVKEDDIALQEINQNADVVIGGGLNYFANQKAGGNRKDGLNLLDSLKTKGYSLYLSPDSLLKSDFKNKLFGILDKEGVPAANERKYTLAQLVKKTIQYLSKDKNGFVLMVEGSQIDWFLHYNEDKNFFSEMSDFNDAITEALNFADKDKNTLVVVTADHETGGFAVNSGNLNGSNLKTAFTTKGHTPSMVGVFAHGKGEEIFSGVFDNYMTGRKLFHLLDSKYKFKN